MKILSSVTAKSTTDRGKSSKPTKRNPFTTIPGRIKSVRNRSEFRLIPWLTRKAEISVQTEEQHNRCQTLQAKFLSKTL